MERLQYKVSPVHIHMGDTQVILFQNQVVVENNI